MTSESAQPLRIVSANMLYGGVDADAPGTDGGAARPADSPQEAAGGHGQLTEPPWPRRAASPEILGFTPLELAVMESAWKAGGWLHAGEIRRLLERTRPTAERTVQAVADVLTRKGHLERSSRDGAWRYRPARPLAGHIAAVIGKLLDASPDPAATLALAGISGLAAARAALPAVRIAVCYDGWWYQSAAGFFAWQRGTLLSMKGLHDAVRWHAAGLLGGPVQHVTVTQAHYVAGRDEGFSSRHDRELAGLGIVRHDMPVTPAKGEVGADVELALTCYQLAVDDNPDMIVLLAGDGDFAPLASRLARLGIRVLVPVADLAYPRSGDGAEIGVHTSALLTREATDTPGLASLLAAADDGGYPPFLARPFPAPPGSGQPGRRRGTVDSWPPGSEFGFITADDGSAWFAPDRETPARTRLPPGTPVTFTGDPVPLPGKSRPRARDILPAPFIPAQ